MDIGEFDMEHMLSTIGQADTEEVEQLLSSMGQMDVLYDKTKQMMWSMVQFKELQMAYSSAIKEVQTKFDILNDEFNLRYKRNPISQIHTRLKRTGSIMHKLVKNGYEISLENIEKYINDVAGIRVICTYIDDIYKLADMLTAQDDITLISKKDYIESPKPNGYRSLHLIVSVPVFLSEGKRDMKVEVQIRTIAMDFWASLEHQITYKKVVDDEVRIRRQLKECAETIAATDRKMLDIRNRIDAQTGIQTEEEMLFERIGKLDTPFG